MSTGIKNGKHHPFNIYILTLFFFFIITTCFTHSASGINDEKKRVIVIDAGHGGKDPGALGSISREKDINLAIALKTGEYIEQNIKNVTVIYTRKDDSSVELYDRPKIANKANADLFISIHTNSTSSKKVMGAETWIMGYTKDQANLEVAMNENAVMLLEDDYSTKYEGFDPKSSESYIMFTLTQKVFQDQSTDLATRIQQQFRERVNRNDRDVKQAGFWVLYKTKMPSVLVETGFITNPAEERYLNSKEGQDFLASSIYRACKDYLKSIDSKSAVSSEKNKDPDQKSDSIPSHGVITPSDVISFKIQVTSSANRIELKPENFNGLTDISEIKSGGRFKYASGSFPDFSDAVSYRKKIETVYPDAFVIAVKDNKILPLQQALEQKKTKKHHK
jgi:N-acetylmuramoyl-L-alanine amidase